MRGWLQEPEPRSPASLIFCLAMAALASEQYPYHCHLPQGPRQSLQNYELTSLPAKQAVYNGQDNKGQERESI